MRLLRLTPLLAAAAVVTACDHAPTQPTAAAQLDSVDSYALIFNATDGLPGAPFQVPGPGSLSGARGPGIPFPDSLKLTDAQKAAIQALLDKFNADYKADLAALKTIHDQARAAIKAGKARADVRAIIETAKPVLQRLHSALDALHDGIANVLTAAQKAWIASHKPAGPPPGGP